MKCHLFNSNCAEWLLLTAEVQIARGVAEHYILNPFVAYVLRNTQTEQVSHLKKKMFNITAIIVNYSIHYRQFHLYVIYCTNTLIT